MDQLERKTKTVDMVIYNVCFILVTHGMSTVHSFKHTTLYILTYGRVGTQFTDTSSFANLRINDRLLFFRSHILDRRASTMFERMLTVPNVVDLIGYRCHKNQWEPIWRRRILWSRRCTLRCSWFALILGSWVIFSDGFLWDAKECEAAHPSSIWWRSRISPKLQSS